jgi:hypothetical protein
MATNVLISKAAFEKHRQALLERAQRDSTYRYRQCIGNECVVALDDPRSAGLFRGYCLATLQIRRTRLELP